MKKIASSYETANSIRRTCGNINPTTKIFKSKKAYNRADKSWKNLD